MPPSKRHPGGNRPAKGSGRPDQKKDRSAHKAARGKKKASFSDLTNELPEGKDLNSYFKMLCTETDGRGCAIMGAAFVEHCLEIAIRCRLADPGEEITDSWFKGPNAPFQTFSAKIQLGRAIAIYGPIMYRSLNGMKDIRNAFAHRALPLDFSHPTIRGAVDAFAPFMREEFDEKDYRVAFATGCIAVAERLIEDARENGGKPIETKFN